MAYPPFRLAWLCASVLLSLSTPVYAGELRERPRVVLELFTSQGCPNSPPADKLLAQLAESPDVIAIAYHVDYWDYAGWQDTFGAAANSALQRDYAATWGRGRLYTPQLVVNGQTGVIGSDRDSVQLAMKSAELPLEINLTVDAGILAIDIDGEAALPRSLVWLVTYVDTAAVEIERGDNKGQTLAYSHAVTTRQLVGMWEPSDGAQLRLPLSEVFAGSSDGAVVLVQRDLGKSPGAILGAASVEE